MTAPQNLMLTQPPDLGYQYAAFFSKDQFDRVGSERTEGESTRAGRAAPRAMTPVRVRGIAVLAGSRRGLRSGRARLFLRRGEHDGRERLSYGGEERP
jgi:hypothetical protein